MRHLLILLSAALLTLNGCEESYRPDRSTFVPPDTSPPPPEVVAALKKQAVGKRLLGHTRIFDGEKMVKADLRSAPDYYLIHFSASF